MSLSTQTTLSQVVLPLRSIGAGDLPQAGGKAANLGEMLALGLPVPDGFCVTCDAYRMHLSDNALDARIQSRLGGCAATAAADIRGWILEAPMPAAVASAIVQAY